LFSRFRLAAGLAYLKLEGNYHRLEKVTAAQWVRKWMGRPAYDKVWGPQLAGKFGAVADTIVASWLWARIKDRTTQLGYLHGGFQQIYNKLAEGIEAKGGEILLGETVTSIASLPDGKVSVKLDDGREFSFDRLVCTFPSRLFVRLAQGLPADYVAKYNWGQAYGATCLILALDHQVIERTYWMSILEPDYPFLAAVEHTNLIDPAEYGGRRLLYLGNYLPMDHPLFNKSAAQMLEEYTPYIKKLNPNFDKSWVTQMYKWQAAYAQPIVTVDYKEHIPPHDTPLPNVYLANMFQVYPHDRGQNYSMEMANQLAARLVGEV
jgi:protoporphyrinogen oxidase